MGTHQLPSRQSRGPAPARGRLRSCDTELRISRQGAKTDDLYVRGAGSLVTLRCRVREEPKASRLRGSHRDAAEAGCMVLPGRYSAQACRRMCTEDVRNSPAINAATAKSGHAVAVLHTPSAAIITTTLPIASLREHSHTERTLASPSL